MSRFRALGALLMILWLIEIVNLLTGHRLNGFGLTPRTLDGLPGIALAPLLHGSLAHLASNTAGLIALGGLVALRGERHFVAVSVAIALLGGTLVWLLGRPALHVGASGLVFGYFGLTVGRAWHERTWDAVVIGLAVIGLYGGMLWGLSPLQGHVSWEGHAAGLVAGFAIARWQARPS